MFRPNRVGSPVGPTVGTDNRSAADTTHAANLFVVMMTDCISFQQCQYEGAN
jgi:hypothetical protein